MYQDLHSAVFNFDAVSGILCFPLVMVPFYHYAFHLQAVSNNRVEFNLFNGVHDLFIQFLFPSSGLPHSETWTFFFFPHLSLTCFLTKCLGFVFFCCFFSFSFGLSLLPQSLASMTSTQVKVNRALSVPPATFDLPLAANHRASVTIAPPSAHIGTAPVQMRLISYDLREGQVLESLFSPYYSGILENSIKSL